MFSLRGKWFLSERLFSLSLSGGEGEIFNYIFFPSRILSFFLLNLSLRFLICLIDDLPIYLSCVFYCLFKYIHLLHLLITLFTSTRYKILIPWVTAECDWNNESNNHWYPACSKFRFFKICKLDVIRFRAVVEVLRVHHIRADKHLFVWKESQTF